MRNSQCWRGDPRVQVTQSGFFAYPPERVVVIVLEATGICGSGEASADLVARTGFEPVLSALRGQRVKPFTLPGHFELYHVH